MKANGWLPDPQTWLSDAFQRMMNNVIDQNSLEMFLVLSIFGGLSLLFGLNIFNNIMAIIRINFEQLYK
jgi:hypothetical protein